MQTTASTRIRCGAHFGGRCRFSRLHRTAMGQATSASGPKPKFDSLESSLSLGRSSGGARQIIGL